MIRFLTAGESHGPCLTGILDGLPAGLAISEAEIAADLKRRQRGYGRGERMQIEQDYARIVGGVRHGRTIGAPVALLIENRDWENWRDKMSVEDPGKLAHGEKLASPRPGHADYAGVVKYHFDDIRNVIERASARETTMRVALAAICRKFFSEFGVRVYSHVVRIGQIESPSPLVNDQTDDFVARVEDSPVRCADRDNASKMVTEIERAIEAKDTLGGEFEVVIEGLPVGLGSYAQHDRRLDALLAQAMLSIPAAKGVEFGMGFAAARSLGSAVHDQMYPSVRGPRRETNAAGGLEGGISNGEHIVLRVAMKPLATLRQPLDSVNLETGAAVQALRERSDVCVVPAAGVVGEAMALLALMNPFLEKFGGDSMTEIDAHLNATPRLPWQ